MITADLLLTNARFLTLDGPDVTSVAVLGGRIAALEDVPARERVDLGGAVVVPGFHDAHNHMAWYGITLAEVDLRLDSIDAALAALAERAAGLAEGQWLVGSGYDANRLGRHPTRDDLDRIAPGRDVWLKHASGHMCVVSTPILRRLGLDEAARSIEGGLVVTDGAGRPTGLLQETAQNLVNDLVLPYPVAELTDAIDRAGRRYVREGITSAVEAGIGGGWIGRTPVELEAYRAAHEQRRLHVRAELMVAADVLHPLGAHASDGLDLGLDLGIRTGFGDEWLRLGPMKIFTDGSLIGRTAAMTRDYADTPGNAGFLQGDPERLTRTIVDAHRAGWRVAAHAIGDAATDLALDAFAQAQRERPRPGVRHRIEHFAVTRPDQLRRAAELGVVPVPQARFVPEFGENFRVAMGAGRLGQVYRLRSLLDAGLVLPGSSDRPVADGAPLRGMQAMVLRETAAGEPFAPHEAITAREALHAYTLGSAYASHQEHRTGSITVGKAADLVVLSDDPTAVAPDRIADVEVLRTMVGGEFAWS